MRHLTRILSYFSTFQPCNLHEIVNKKKFTTQSDIKKSDVILSQKLKYNVKLLLPKGFCERIKRGCGNLSYCLIIQCKWLMFCIFFLQSSMLNFHQNL